MNKLNIDALIRALNNIDYDNITELEQACLDINNWIANTPHVKGYCRT